MRLAKLRVGRSVADEVDREQFLVLERERLSLETERAGLKKELNELVIRAPISGTVLELASKLEPGRWVGRDLQLALVGKPGLWEATGYVSEADVWRVSDGADGTFIPDAPFAEAIPVRLDRVASQGAEHISTPALSSVYGGQIGVNRGENDRLIPIQAAYQVKLSVLSRPTGQNSEFRGLIHLAGRPESFAARAWRQVLKVFAREAGV